MNFNKAIIGGRLTRDPERIDVGKTSKLVFCLATDVGWGEHKKTMFLDCFTWGNMGKTADNIERYFKKGDPILVEGQLEPEEWTDKKTGEPRKKTTLKVMGFTFVGGGADDTPPQSPPRSARYKGQQRDAEGEVDDDLPF